MKKIVYVSCDLATLARDLKILNGLDYKVLEVQLVYMFPPTANVENIVMMMCHGEKEAEKRLIFRRKYR